MTEEEKAIHQSRSDLTENYIRGRGIEVGAGSRPVPIPRGALVSYGDIRDELQLKKYFSDAQIPKGNFIDAQSFQGVPNCSFDFIISAHVLEHLRDPVGAIFNALDRLVVGGIFFLVVPDRRFTWDRERPNTSIQHAMADFADGGESTTVQGYDEHLRYVHPIMTSQHLTEEEIIRQSHLSAARWRELDIHFHAWDREALDRLLGACGQMREFELLASQTIVNENQYILKRK
ncbi:MAG: methyltransferase domain-containing protein [Phycisphaerae bacterium]